MKLIGRNFEGENDQNFEKALLVKQEDLAVHREKYERRVLVYFFIFSACALCS